MAGQIGETVCVTGASGFIASHLVQQLLDEGYRVRGTVRREPSSYPHLTELPGARDRLELVTADLLDNDAIERAVAGAVAVIHTASPYVLDVKDPQRDLVDPAVQGTTNVLRACIAGGTARRVIVTSSMAAITDQPDSNHVYTEADWNDESSLTRNPYYFSKTLAERAAWELSSAADGLFDVITLNPFMVIGPSMTPSLNTSNQLIVDVLTGTYPGVLNVAWGFVDVRDVARAHVLALQTASASGRYICANVTMTMQQLVSYLRESGHDRYDLPRRNLQCQLGDFAIRLGSYFQPRGIGSYLRTHLGRIPYFDNAKIRRELDLTFRPIETTIEDTLADLQRWRHLEPPPAE